jgi:pSer/pThr/pTyr-binding forkhead associated (FHA) protein
LKDIYYLSANGTFLNGRKIGKGNKNIVKHGDEISLVAKRGNTDCMYNWDFNF